MTAVDGIRRARHRVLVLQGSVAWSASATRLSVRGPQVALVAIAFILILATASYLTAGPGMEADYIMTLVTAVAAGAATCAGAVLFAYALTVRNAPERLATVQSELELAVAELERLEGEQQVASPS